jgi:hypothetical protein
MIKRIKEILEFGSTNGFYTATAYDNDKGKGSTTLLFANSAHYLTLVIIAVLAYKDINNGAMAAIIYSVITMVLYMMRRLSKVKVDADERSIELDAGEKDE